MKQYTNAFSSNIYLLIQVYLQCRSVFRGGSITIFMFAYGLYFYARANARISMNLIVFLGYNACIFYAVVLMLGTIGFYASSIGFHGPSPKEERLKSSVLSHVDPKRDSTSFYVLDWQAWGGLSNCFAIFFSFWQKNLTPWIQNPWPQPHLHCYWWSRNWMTGIYQSCCNEIHSAQVTFSFSKLKSR